MKQFYLKLKLIFLPYLVVSFCTIAAYRFLYWLLLIKFNAVKINEDVPNFFIPLILPWVPLLIGLRRRLKALDLKTDGRKDPITAILFLNWITIAIPLILAQKYVVTATGKLTRLNYISDINASAPTKYYTVKHFYINKRMVHGHTIFSVSGKNNNNFDMTIYAAVPVFDHIFPDTNMIAAIRDRANKKALIILNGKLIKMKQLKQLPADSILRMRYVNPTIVMPMYGDTGKYGAIAVVTKGYKKTDNWPVIKFSPVAWLTVTDRETISNNLTFGEKQRRFKTFASASYTRFLHKNLNNFTYLDRVPNGRDFKHYTDAITQKGDVTEGVPIILSPVFEPFEARNGNRLAWIFGSFGIGSAVFILILSLVDLKDGATTD